MRKYVVGLGSEGVVLRYYHGIEAKNAEQARSQGISIATDVSCKEHVYFDHIEVRPEKRK